MTNLRKGCTGRWPVHLFQSLAVAAALGVASPVLSAPAQSGAAKSAPAKAVPVQRVGQGIDDFYTARSNAPLWLSPKGGDGSRQLLDLLRSSWIDMRSRPKLPQQSQPRLQTLAR